MLLFIVLFLGIISGKGASFLSGGGGGWVPHGGGSVLMGRFKKICWNGGASPMPPLLWETLGVGGSKLRTMKLSDL